jgi:hypothetical protein
MAEHLADLPRAAQPDARVGQGWKADIAKMRLIKRTDDGIRGAMSP